MHSIILILFSCKNSFIFHYVYISNKNFALHEPFSTFWLRANVVFIFINLIFDIWANESHDISLLFLWRGRDYFNSCYWFLKCRHICVVILHGLMNPTLKNLIKNLLEFSLFICQYFFIYNLQ